MEKYVVEVNEAKEWFSIELTKLDFIDQVFESHANFVLVKVEDANKLYNYLVEQGVIVRNRTNIALCLGCLRITVGTPVENETLIESLKKAAI